MRLHHCHRASCVRIVAALEGEINRLLSELSQRHDELHQAQAEIARLRANIRQIASGIPLASQVPGSGLAPPPPAGR